MGSWCDRRIPGAYDHGGGVRDAVYVAVNSFRAMGVIMAHVTLHFSEKQMAILMAFVLLKDTGSVEELVRRALIDSFDETQDLGVQFMGLSDD